MSYTVNSVKEKMGDRPRIAASPLPVTERFGTTIGRRLSCIGRAKLQWANFLFACSILAAERYVTGARSLHEQSDQIDIEVGGTRPEVLDRGRRVRVRFGAYGHGAVLRRVRDHEGGLRRDLHVGGHHVERARRSGGRVHPVRVLRMRGRAVAQGRVQHAVPRAVPRRGPSGARAARAARRAVDRLHQNRPVGRHREARASWPTTSPRRSCT